MAPARLATVVAAVVLGAAGASRASLRPSTALATVGTDAASARAALDERIRSFKAEDPLFSEESCTKMHETKLKLGGPVPPGEFVKGCGEVCMLAHEIYSYWGSGDMAEYACGIATKFNCVLDTLPPKKVC
mmetsp:Transcript_32622/g.75823  ORF Transcript_32622/g.75823 Transcript_32622/m.75823 type:complete len:131 (-) Transcript_32622:87-479(-)